MKETFGNLKVAYKYAKKYIKHLIWLVVAMVIGVLLGIILPLLTAKQIVYFTSSIWEQLIIVSLVIVGLKCFKSFIAMYFHRRNSKKLTMNIMKDLQYDLGQKILKIRQIDIDKTTSGVFIQRVLNDTEKIATFFFELVSSGRLLFSSVGALIATLCIDWRVFLYYLVVSIILSIVHIIKTDRKGKKDIEFRNETENVSGLIGELVRGSRDIKMLNARRNFMNVLYNNIEVQNNKRFEMSDINAKYTFVIEVLTEIFEIGLVVLMVFLIKSGTLSIPMALALFNYESSIMVVLMEKVSALVDCTKSFNISCNRVFALINEEKLKEEDFGDIELNRVVGNIEYKNVNFGFNEEKLVLKDLSFDIKAGSMVGFVGKSGVGKTTLFNLLCKLYNVNSGEILVDDVNINKLTEQSIRKNITIINQEPYIFNLSIKDNLRLVKDDLTEEEMINACRIACLEDYINSLPNKYDTVVGESGVILSGGQKQRLAIARVLVQKSRIILFDEATSSLDNETQLEIQKTINNIRKEYGCTILIIAHRLSTIVNCDSIIFIDNGKVLCCGTHDYLLESSKEYNELYSSEIKK